MVKPAALKALVLSRWSLVAFSILFAFITFSIFNFQFSISNVHAQVCETPTSNPQEAINVFNKCAIEKDIFDDKIFNANQITGTADSLYMLLLGESKVHPETNVATKGGGLLAASGKLVSSLYSVQPISGVQYFAQKIQDINPVKPAYAQQGIGFQTLSPAQPIWVAFRNASYIGFIIVFVIMGFMIMFRHRISPQAVATVQDSIPRIVIALILVTFSYAIAGLMIDIMFLSINIVIGILAPAGLDAADAQNVFTQSILGILSNSWDDVVMTVGRAINQLIDELINLPAALEWLDNIVSFFGGVLAGLIVGIAVLFVMFRVFFMLLIAYVMIIMLTVTAPFFFLIQALPGMNGASQWFRQMASHVAVFAAVAIMLIFAGLIGGIEDLGGTGTSLLEGEIGNFPLLSGGLSVNAIGKLIAIGFILATPSAADMVKKAIGTQGQGGGMGAGAMASLGGGAAVAGAAGRGAWGRAYTKGPLGEGGRQAEAVRQERSQLQAREKIYQKPSRVGLTKEQLQKRGLGYGD